MGAPERTHFCLGELQTKPRFERHDIRYSLASGNPHIQQSWPGAHGACRDGAGLEETTVAAGDIDVDCATPASFATCIARRRCERHRDDAVGRS